MILDKKFEEQFLIVSSRAALAAYHLVGKKDKKMADKFAVDSMRLELNKIDMKGEIVIGEGELDEAPMLYIGEKLASTKGPELDIAVDPLEGTNFAANNLPGALSVIAASYKNNLLNVPETAIIIEPNSSTVRESAIETYEILGEKGLEPTVILVTSAIKIRRASLTFTDLGIKTIPAPTDFNTVNPYADSSYRFVLADFLPNTEALVLTTDVWEEYLVLFYYFLRGWLAPSF